MVSATVRPAKRKESSPMRRSHRWVTVLFVGPATVGFLVFVLAPLLMTIYYSFTSYGLFDPPEFNGVANYERLLDDSRLLRSYINTFIFMLLAVPLNVGLGLLLAVGLNRAMNKTLRTVVRSAYFFPSLVGLVFVSIVWQFFFQTDSGVFNYYLGLIGIEPVQWLSSPAMAIPSIVILDVWKNLGLAMLILLAGLQGIPKVYYEAASLDGAGPIQRFFSVTIPLLSPQLFFVLTYYLIGALKVFESIVVLTGGGPGDASRSVVMYIYEQAFENFNFGYASAISVSLLAIVAVVTFLQFQTSKKWVHYE